MSIQTDRQTDGDNQISIINEERRIEAMWRKEETDKR